MNEPIPGGKLAERLLLRGEGATMDEIIAATGGPQYNLLRKLEARGYKIRKAKEGRTTRYFATAPAGQWFEATVTGKGQVTIPKEVREHLRLAAGKTLRFSLDEADRVTITPAYKRLSELVGVLPKAERVVSVEEMDEAIAKGAVERYRRSVGRRR